MWGWDLVDLSSSQATWSWRARARGVGEVGEDGRGVGPGEVGATGEDGVDIDVAGEVAELAACGGGERAGRLVDEEDARRWLARRGGWRSLSLHGRG